MKKIFTLLVALISISTLFAQSGRYGQYSGNGSNTVQTRGYDRGGQQGYDNNYYSQDHQRSYNNGYNNERSHYEGYSNERNRGYDGRDNRDYRSHNTYGREYGRRNERSGNALGAVGAGLIVGGIIAIIAGSH